MKNNNVVRFLYWIHMVEQKKYFLRIARCGALVMAAALAGCGGGGGSSDSGPAASSGGTTTTLPVAVATAVGEPNGAAASATIGAAGGSLTSLDGSLSLTIPPGALGADTNIQIQPITNLAHGGLAQAFRLAPNGQTFAQPVTLTFTYADQDIADAAPEVLGVAFQTPEGYWQLANNISVDKNAKTVSATTTHFTDWAYVEQFRINPAYKVVKVNGAANFQVEMCYPVLGERDATGERPILGTKCGPFSLNIAGLLLSDWAVNGVVGGDNTYGTVYDNIDQGGYEAPATVPGSGIVALSVNLKNLSDKKLKAALIANITVTDKDSYFGTVKFSGKRIENGVVTEYSGTAHLDFLVGDQAEGTTQYDLNTDPIWTEATFDKWDVSDDLEVCHLVNNARTPYVDNKPTGWLKTYSILSSYVFLAEIQVVGTHQCVATDGNVTTEEVYPVVMFTTSPVDGDPGFQPLGDSMRLTGSVSYTSSDGVLTQTSDWDLTKM